LYVQEYDKGYIWLPPLWRGVKQNHAKDYHSLSCMLGFNCISGCKREEFQIYFSAKIGNTHYTLAKLITVILFIVMELLYKFLPIWE